jgi:tRNA (cmo5U34)-methyltransferase
MPAMRDNQTAHAARDYDAEITRTVPHYEMIQAEILDLVRAVQPSPAAWLDTGCGTGRLVERALPLFPSTRFLLVDPSEAMLAQAQKRIGADERVTWLPPTGTQGIAPPPSPPDVITAILCHHYLRPDEREGCLAHCHQLLSKGGLLVSVEIVAPATDRGRSLGLERWRRFQTEQGRSTDDVARHLERLGTHLFPISLEAHLALLRRVGFQVVEPFWLAGMQAGVYGIRG